MGFIKGLFSEAHIRDIAGSDEKYRKANARVFEDEQLINDVTDISVMSIIDNEFVADPSKLILELRKRHNFTVNEFYIILFKIGLLTGSYTTNPILLLKDAIKMTEYYSEKQIESFKVMLETQQIQDDEKLEAEYKALKQRRIDAKIRAGEELDADTLIDNWLAKNKKK